jgi:hypothetical protein
VRRPALLALLALLGASASSALAAPDGDWIDVGYRELLDVRELSHSGEPVGALVERLAKSTDDSTAHTLLDPLLEPYAFVLSDAIDALDPSRSLVEVGRLWAPGEAQPAWAELLRARRLVVESDGQGRLRLFLPLLEPVDPGEKSSVAARRAYEDAWPVLRHVFRSELVRLRASARDAALSIEARAYQHFPERTTFRLGRGAYTVDVRDTASNGKRAPLDLDAIGAFLASGLELEGGRLEADGRLRLLGSQTAKRPTILGRPVGLGDLAVAYRAVFHGGLAEPYMSLDRGRSPQTSIVNYGGRLRDTSIGLVSLLCDMRFKTFSLGIDLPTGDDVRDRVRRTVPGFRSHLERIAEDPGSAGFRGQQTRLWFYPDSVDLTVSPESDALVMRRVRMSAASERVEGAMNTSAGGDPPWTRATVDEIDADYDGLARHFPELADLDEVVRMLSFFTWLREAARAGHPVPDLDVLLAVEIPAEPTPRTFPQLLAFTALPEPGKTGDVVVYDRLPVGEALERLHPSTGPALAARERLEAAKAQLDAKDPQMAALLDELSRTDAARTDEVAQDLLAYRAERLRMHALVLSTLGAERTAPLLERDRGGEKLRVFSVGIGGLDLGMGPALARATGRSIGLAAVGAERPTSAPASTARVATGESAGVPVAPIPDHGAAASSGESRLEPKLVRMNESGLEVTTRRMTVDAAGKATRFERIEAGRRLTYAFVREGVTLRARLERSTEPKGSAPPETVRPPGALSVLQVRPAPVPGDAVWFESHGSSRTEQTLSRSALTRLLLGHEFDTTPDEPLPGSSAPDAAGAIEARMVLVDPSQRVRPWDGSTTIALPSDRDPLHLARALGAWSPEAAPVVLGTDPDKSPARWSAAPSVRGKMLLVLPKDAFPGATAALRERLTRAVGGAIVEDLPATIDAPLVLVVAHEAPDRFAARLRRLARQPALSGKLLAAWSLGGSPRDDLPAWILAESGIAALGLGEPTPLPLRGVEARLGAYADAVRTSTGAKVERIPGPFLWFY